MLTHLFTPQECAQCKLCCNFRRCSAWETPALEPELATRLDAAGVPLETRADGSRSFRLHFCSSDPDEAANCPMLDPHAGCTLPREQRPFECRIWPLRIMRTESGEQVLGLYTGCPALTERVRCRLIAEATGALRPRLLEYAQQHPASVRPVDPAYTIIG